MKGPSRHLIYAAAVAIGVVAISCSPLGTQDAADAEPLQVLLFTGGGWHDYPAQVEILTEGLGERVHAEFTVDHEGGEAPDARVSRHQDTAWAEEFDVVVYNMCYSGIHDREWTDRIVRAHVAHQVPAVALHCTMHTYNYEGHSPVWSMFLGVLTRRHQQQMPFTVEPVEADHPILRGVTIPWETPAGELYEILDLYPTATPLARAFGEDSGEDHVTIWTNEFAGVRVFGTTIGHHNETMSHENYLDLVASGLLWAADKLDDEGRAVAGFEVR